LDAQVIMPANSLSLGGETWSEPVKVLILGDSMGLCGFGERLDRNFRRNLHTKATFTYLAGGTNPLSWLKDKPYTTIKTYCGFMRFESVESTPRVNSFIGDDGKPYTVPKIEDLLETTQPDILIVQNGNNLYDLFRDRETVNREHNGPLLDAYIVPFLSKIVAHGPQLRKVYWVAPPITGRISQDIQDFLVEELQARTSGLVTVIDSRPLVSYPYKNMQKDQTHFVGVEMNQWADKVFAIIEQDLSAKPFASLPVLASLPPPPPAKKAERPEAKAPEETIAVDAELTFKSDPIPTQELLPYKESLVAFVYKVRKVISGNYKCQKIVVMHPAHIGLKPQELSNFAIGKKYKLRLSLLAKTAWRAEKCRDDSSELDLEPYIQVEDEKRYPNHVR